MSRQQSYLAAWMAAALLSVSLVASQATADAWDPPAGYYNWATGTGATLKAQLNQIIDSTDDPGFVDELHTPVSYDSLRSFLQVSDADPNNPGHILLVYNRVSLNVSQINPGGPIPGWDSGSSWDREHTWPQSRGLDGTGMPDGSDMHALRPSTPSVNNNRGNRNFAGMFGAQSFGVIDLPGVPSNDDPFYPGDADAGMIARHSFYMDTRYDGADSNTNDLQVVNGNPGINGSTMGELSRMIEWHYAAPPDDFERRRNHVIYSNYQHNRNPFIDRPEFAWSVFMGNTNDSQLTIVGGTSGGNGATTRNVDLGRVFTGAAVPVAQPFTLNKDGNAGTYFEVATSGQATSSLTGRYNAFCITGTCVGQTNNKSISIGLNTSTATAGLRSGTVTIDNLDITTGGGAGRGANDGNDVFNVSLTVLDHAQPSFQSGVTDLVETLNFGNVPVGSVATLPFTVFNRLATASFTANMDFDSIVGSGDTSIITTNAGASVGSLVLGGGASHVFTATLDTSATGTFSTAYTFHFSDEDITGALSKSITLNLTGTVRLPGDYDGDGNVNAVDFVAWRSNYGSSAPAYGSADGNGDTFIDDGDYDVWLANYGETAPAAGGGSSAGAAVPEPGTLAMLMVAAACCVVRRRSR